ISFKVRGRMLKRCSRASLEPIESSLPRITLKPLLHPSRPKHHPSSRFSALAWMRGQLVAVRTLSSTLSMVSLLTLLIGFVAPSLTLAQAPSASPRPITFFVPETLPPGMPACLTSTDVEILDFPTIVERFPGVPDAATRLQKL